MTEIKYIENKYEFITPTILTGLLRLCSKDQKLL